MKKLLLSAFLLNAMVLVVSAQDKEDAEEKKGFKLDNLFTGGSVSLGFGSAYGSSSFTIGASPIFGYSITNWLDAGITVNYSYQSTRDYPYDGGKLRQSLYGGGGFAKIYPVEFIFAQAQFEHNFGTQKQIYQGITDKYTYDVNSLLVGGGVSFGRQKYSKVPFFYLSVLFDVSGNLFTPYTNTRGNAIPIIRGGFQIPLFQGKSRGNQPEYEEQRGSGGKRPRNYNRY
ncbi:MAG: hypothetical protein JST09_17145 [Bacteroidetes bacterium]|nr:hypothetical protein [Bacteroidota bacterium]